VEAWYALTSPSHVCGSSLCYERRGATPAWPGPRQPRDISCQGEETARGGTGTAGRGACGAGCCILPSAIGFHIRGARQMGGVADSLSEGDGPVSRGPRLSQGNCGR